MNINFVGLSGNVTADPDVKENVAKFSIANNRGWGDKKRTNFFNCVCFGKLVKTVSDYVKKGKEVFVKGEIKEEKYEGKSYVQILVSELILITKKIEDMGKETHDAPPIDSYGDDDIPM